MLMTSYSTCRSNIFPFPNNFLHNPSFFELTDINDGEAETGPESTELFVFAPPEGMIDIP